MDKNQYEDGRLTAAALINFEGRGRTTPRFLESGLTKIDLIHNFKITVNLAGLIKNFKKQACMAQQDWAYEFPDQTGPDRTGPDRTGHPNLPDRGLFIDSL